MNKKTLWLKSLGALSGKQDWREVSLADFDIPVVKAFWEDDDLQEMTVASGNIGIVYTFQKRLAKVEKAHA